ncbi:glutathione S-transferase family protein [Kordiimonas sp. SCSIO 12610]|uniref:glutathione S-transferase family protein n=1 Tax=Kordiimonas sp. SCSIO 12610 TaxID=2829597 RepID=UPI00210DF6B2|nr:glutathione S-transferase [Kordiimonas sp. SCSIO 12610]UTW56283.1 glutathione S-transferase [Kordiimonas sp. SCSIO 12610]
MTNPSYTNANPIKLYWFPLSGHAHRAQLMLSLLDLPHELITVDLAGGEQKTPEFLADHPFGQVPVLDDNGVKVWDSNAILVYLAAKYDPARTWLPEAPEKAADVQKWLSVAAGPIFNGPCAVRLVKLFNADFDHTRALKVADDLFKIMDPFLKGRNFLTGDEPTIADVAAYSYIAHSPEGGANLSPYGEINTWLERIEALPGFVGMQKSPAA